VVTAIAMPQMGRKSVGSDLFPGPPAVARIPVTALGVDQIKEDVLRAVESEALARDRLGGGNVRDLFRRIRRAAGMNRSRAEPVLQACQRNFTGDADCARATAAWLKGLGVALGPDDAGATDAGVLALVRLMEANYDAERADKLMEEVMQDGEALPALMAPLYRAPHLHLPLLELQERLGGQTFFLGLVIDYLGVHSGSRIALRSGALLPASAYVRTAEQQLARAALPNHGPDAMTACTSAAALVVRSTIAPSVLLVLLSLLGRAATEVASAPRAHPHAAARLAAASKPLLFAADALVGAAGPATEAAGSAEPPALSVAVMEAAVSAASDPVRAAAARHASAAASSSSAADGTDPAGALGAGWGAATAELRGAVAACATAFTMALPGEGDPRLAHPAAGCDSAAVVSGAERLAGIHGSRGGDGENDPAAPSALLDDGVPLAAPILSSQPDAVSFGRVGGPHQGAALSGSDAAARAAAAAASALGSPPSSAQSSSSSSSSAAAAAPPGLATTVPEGGADGMAGSAPGFNPDGVGPAEGAWASLSPARGEGGLDACAAAGAPRGWLPRPCLKGLERLCQAIERFESAYPSTAAVPTSSFAADVAGSASGFDGPPAAAGRPLPSASPPSTAFDAATPGAAAPRAGAAVDPVASAAAAVVRLPALTCRLLSLLFHPSAPTASRHALAFATRALAFATVAPDDRAEAAQHLQMTATLCREAHMGLTADGMAGRLAMAASHFPCAAAGVLLWCRGVMGSAALAGGAMFRSEAVVLVRLVAKIAELHRPLAPRALVVLRRALRLRRPGSSGEDAIAVKTEALTAAVRIMADAGAALPAMAMLTDEIRLYSLDAGLARVAVSQVLEAASPDFTRGFLQALLELLRALAERGHHEGMTYTAKARATAAAEFVRSLKPPPATASAAAKAFADHIRAVADEVAVAYA